MVSKYFSMHSLRPGSTTTVPFSGRADGGKQAIADLLAVALREKAAGGIFRRRIARDFVEEVRHSALLFACLARAGVGMVIDAMRQKQRRWRPGRCKRSKAGSRFSAASGLCRPGRKGRYTRFGLVAAPSSGAACS